MEKKGIHFDFRTKLFSTFVLAYTLLMGNLQQKYFYVAVFYSLLPFVLLLINRKFEPAIKGIIFISFAALLEKYLIYNLSGLFSTFLLFFTILILRMLPGITMGKYTFLSTDMSDLVYSLKKMKTPDVILIPIAVMARFFYTASEDYKEIKEAMYLHGLTTRRLITQPGRLFEYRVVPLLMCLTKTADDVTISAMTRGLEVGKNRSSISNAKLRFPDLILFLLMLILIGFYIGGKYVRV